MANKGWKVMKPHFMWSKNWISIIPELSISINDFRYNFPNIQVDFGLFMFHGRITMRKEV